MKDKYMHMRVTRELKRAMEKAAKEEQRSVANLVEMILLNWLKEKRDE